MIISGCKSVKKGQKIPKKDTNWTYNVFSKKKFVLAIFKNINSQKMIKKKLVSLYNFRSNFFPLAEVNGSFLNLLTRANNYRKILSDFFEQISHWVLSICMKKCAENCSFYELKVQKIVTFSAPNISDPLPTLNIHLIINNTLL